MVYSINLKGKIGLMEVTDRTISGTFAANPDELKVLEKVYSVPGKVLNPDGSFKPCDIVV